MDTYHVYRSRGGKFVLHTQHSDWNELSEQGNWLKGLGDWRTLLGIGSPNWGNFTLDVFETLDELRDRVPPQFFTMVVSGRRASHRRGSRHLTQLSSEEP